MGLPGGSQLSRVRSWASFPAPLEGAGEGGGDGQSVVDSLQDFLGLSEHLVIPEPDDPIASLLEPLATLPVLCGLLQVLRAVQLHDQLSLQADEVYDVGAQRMLPAELAVEQLTPSQACPQGPLGIGHVLAQLLCFFSAHALNTAPPLRIKQPEAIDSRGPMAKIPQPHLFSWREIDAESCGATASCGLCAASTHSQVNVRCPPTTRTAASWSC